MPTSRKAPERKNRSRRFVSGKALQQHLREAHTLSARQREAVCAPFRSSHLAEDLTVWGLWEALTYTLDIGRGAAQGRPKGAVAFGCFPCPVCCELKGKIAPWELLREAPSAPDPGRRPR